VESTVGLGSVFWFELHSATAPQLAIDRTEPVAVSQTQVQPGAPLRTLLYVEDNPANLMLVEQLCGAPSGYAPVECQRRKSGHPARARQPAGGDPGVDINLTRISGIEALRILRDDPRRRNIPIVALSAKRHAGRHREGAWMAGFFRYLTKPIKVNEFMQTLDVALGNSPGKRRSCRIDRNEAHGSAQPTF